MTRYAFANETHAERAAGGGPTADEWEGDGPDGVEQGSDEQSGDEQSGDEQSGGGPDGALHADLAAHDASRYADPRITAIGLLVETVDGLNKRFETQWAAHDLSSAEFEVLMRLARTPGGALRMSDLAAQTMLTTSGITRVVDRLERRRLVERRACRTDRRGSFAHITAAGLARLDAALPGHIELVERWLIDRFTPEQLNTLLTLMRTIRDEVRPGATAGVTL